MPEEVPKKGLGAVCVNEGPDFHLEIRDDLDVPEPKDDELLVRLNVTGLCQSDIHNMTRDWNAPPMSSFGVRCTGHEGAGVVVKVGSRCGPQWKVGDRVGIKPLLDTCHNCEPCWHGRENYCPTALYTGHTVPGTYQQYLVSPAIYTTRIPDGVPDEVAGPIMCSASTMHRALIESELKPGNWVVFPGGGGGVGIQGIQLAKAMGFRPIAIDAGSKKEQCLKLGAEAFIDFREVKDVPAEVVKIAGGIGAHGVIVTAWQSYKDSFAFIGKRIGGRIMVIALPAAGEGYVGGEPSEFVFRNLHVVGSLVGTMQDAAACLDYAKRGLLKSVAEVRGKSQWAESVEQLRRGQVVGRIVIDFNRD